MKNQINIKLESELIDLIDILAEEEHRTRSNFINHILMKHLEKELEKLKPADYSIYETELIQENIDRKQKELRTIENHIKKFDPNTNLKKLRMRLKISIKAMQTEIKNREVLSTS